MTTPDSAMQADPFDAALAHVLTLPKAEQARLAEVMAVLVRSDVIGNQAQENRAADQISAPPLAEWLGEIEGNDPWTRLQLIDDASTKIDPDEDGGELEAARRAILSAHPPLAVRYAVSQLVDQHPWACLFGSIGLCLGLIAAGRGLFRLVF
jgi:hypothetical protein